MKLLFRRFRSLADFVAPSRVRGLKLSCLRGRVLRMRVAPSRVRGLKQIESGGTTYYWRVAPSRVRGLKHRSQISVIDALCRTLTGAWIETIHWILGSPFSWRRTLTGAWIETALRICRKGQERVAPSRVRGLKLFILFRISIIYSRTLTGAWIETGILGKSCLHRRSHPHGCVD